ncbi:hypothetical protein N8368_05295 [Bacteroidia bacterium]|nr:hypothetical protein [Bacteroidia bacterium]MDB4107042.1 hypothetical protein [Bacteroidia bacterium]MDB9882490.1 hypothetical protein [Bacteroidia bacterium]MDC1395903.1 hypothetical protein [Bacteroidia bacterium]
MFRILYILLTWELNFLSWFICPFSKKLDSFFYARKNTPKVKSGKIKYWIHAASLGEYEMALPVLEELLKKNSLEDILITIFSPSGYSQAIKGPYSGRVMYSPIDTLWQVKSFYKKYAPEKAIFIRYDFWYNLIKEGQINETTFYLINGRFSKNHFFFKRYGKPYLNLLKKFKGLYLSDKLSVTELQSAGIMHSKYTGDTRADRVATIAKNAKQFLEIEKFKGDRNLLILGSSWQPEEDLLLKLLQNKPNNLAVIIAPHDLKRSDSIASKLALYKPKIYTDSSFDDKTQVLIVNTMGMLSSLYQYADFAIIGGGFSGALHNILEPAVWGCHLSFGPKISKFPEAQDFLNEGFAYKITETEKWVKTIVKLNSDSSLLHELQEKSRTYMVLQKGATQTILNSLA